MSLTRDEMFVVVENNETKQKENEQEFDRNVSVDSKYSVFQGSTWLICC